MSGIWHAVLLGVVEGMTEFLPVSSTGHLLVAERLLLLAQEHWEAFTIIIQLGAILAVVAVYWRKFRDVLVGLPTSSEARHFALAVFVACLPAAVAGALLIRFINEVLLRPGIVVPVIATMWILGGLLMLVLERVAPEPRYLDGDRLPLVKAFQIGLCQMLAIIPGVSRSGATILGAELFGVERKAAATFTFYLAVPTMLGASVLELYKKGAALSAGDAESIAIGFVVAFVFAYGVVKTFIAFIGRHGLAPFGWYRIAAGLAVYAWRFL